jgi:hypothetical protein
MTLPSRVCSVLSGLVVALAFPAAAFAEDARLVTQEVPLRGERSLTAARPSVFHLVGLHWQGPGTVHFRTRSTSGRWSAWRDAQPSPLDIPDAGTDEGTDSGRPGGNSGLIRGGGDDS